MAFSWDEWRQWLAQTHEICMTSEHTTGMRLHYRAVPGTVPMSGQIEAYNPAIVAYGPDGKKKYVTTREFRIHCHLN